MHAPQSQASPDQAKAQPSAAPIISHRIAPGRISTRSIAACAIFSGYIWSRMIFGGSSRISTDWARWRGAGWMNWRGPPTSTRRS